MSFCIKKLEKTKSSLGRIERLLWTLESDYVPPLSTYLDIHLYAKKLLRNADVFIADVQSSDVGIIAIYSNDMDARSAFISTISVSRNARGSGIGEALIDAAITNALSKGMLRIRLEVSRLNKSAISLYQRFGFEQLIAGSSATYEDSITMEKVINSEDDMATTNAD